MELKQNRAKRAEAGNVKLNKSMNIADMIKVLEPEIRKALPSVITPERFTRMALSAINNTSLSHTVNCVTAAATNADYFNVCNVLILIINFECHF